jgi:hypothetical protein
MSQGLRAMEAMGDQPAGNLAQQCRHLLEEGTPAADGSGGSLVRLLVWLANCGLSADAPPLIRPGGSRS